MAEENEKRENGMGDQSGEQKSQAPKKKLTVVFRRQNSTTIKDIPRNLRRAAGERSVGDTASTPQRKSRPLPVGTKPVRPASSAVRQREEEENAQEAAAVRPVQPAAGTPQPETVQTVEKAPQIEALNPEEVKSEDLKESPTLASAVESAVEAAGNIVSEVTAPQEEKSDTPAVQEESSVPPDTSETPAAASPSETRIARPEKTRQAQGKNRKNKDRSGESPASVSAAQSTEAPRLKVVKSYADYDAAAIIAAASKKARSEATPNDRGVNGEKKTGTKQRSASPRDSAAKTGSRTFVSRGTFQGGRSGQAPGQARNAAGASAPAGRASKDRGSAQKNRSGAYNKDRRDKKDKYVDEPISRQRKKGAFIKPEPKAELAEEAIKVITVAASVTIKELAEKLRLQPSAIVKKLFLEGRMVTPNTDLSYEEAEEIALSYDVLCEPEVETDVIAELLREDEEDESRMLPRNPVVCVMGHVDHGKTSLLDAIRNTNVTDQEAGGITQHIGASVVKAGDRYITFLDTPGHEAFTAMRLRGAQSTDIAVLVVAADDGVKPQTIEAINHAKAAQVEVIVAINKMDKPEANPDMVRNELSEFGLVSDEWGGNTPMVEVSAKTGAGIEDLLDIILLQADVMELKANPDRLARGLVIEAELDKGRGPVATVLVQKGTLRVGDNVVAGSSYGKVRAMMNDRHEQIKSALPSYPAEILGLNDVPGAGEVFMVCKDEKEARSIAETFIAEQKKHMVEETRKKMNLEDLFDEIKAGNIKELPIIVKADVQGSVEAVKQSLGKLSNEEVAVKVIHAAPGNINESDVNLASASNAVIIGFNVKPDAAAKARAEEEKVDIRLYKVIYQAIDDLKAALTGMLAPVYEEQLTGKAIVRQTFKASGVGVIAGCYVTDGVIEKGSRARLSRAGKQLFDGDIVSLRRFKDEVKEVRLGFECGMVLDDFSDIMEDDTLEIYKMVQVART